MAALGGGASLNNTTGAAVTGPTFPLANANGIAGTTGAATDVGSGFGKIDTALGKLNTSISGNATAIGDLTNQLNNGTIGLVQQAAAGQNLTVGKNIDGAAVNFADKDGAARRRPVRVEHRCRQWFPVVRDQPESGAEHG
ncbi:unnamed protein product [Candidatus Paraburkholderia kirkii UZHbot1]|uniref:WGS project CAFE00000000 data, contig bkir_c177 n=1 Tax=Candidatus Paraburkholderia kirkii UZHbot1 TaxID=1055526 RepID=U3UAL6_9BURK|nr:unnamed protein product [Candidatus Paraburkholderia kirkii UZHbot1]